MEGQVQVRDKRFGARGQNPFQGIISFKYIGIYVCILLVAVDPAVGYFQVCANALACGSEILFMIICTSIFVYIYTHTH